MPPILSLDIQLEELRRGNRLIEELGADDVERLVVHVLKKDFPEYDIEDCTGHGGPIDVVMRRLSTSPSSQWNGGPVKESTYIECKHYSRKLELDAVAKVFVVAVVDKPNELIIVSSSALGPQAERCAKYLFVQPLGQHTGPGSQARPPMREPSTVTGTVFRLLRLETLLGITPAPLVSPTRRRGKQKPSWTLVEETPFLAKPLIHDGGAIKLSPSGTYRVTINMRPPTELATCSGLLLRIKRANHPRRLFRIGVPVTDSDIEDIEFFIQAVTLTPTVADERHELAVIVEWRDGENQWRTAVPLFRYKLTRLLPALPDLRGTRSEALADDFVEDASKHIFVTHGEGGTGKTWLSNLAARKVQTAAGATCQILQVDDVTSVEMLRTVAWNLMMPALPMPSGDVDLVAFGEHWLDGAAKAQLAQDYRGAFRELFDGNGGSADAVDGGADSGSLALALAVLLIHSPTPQVLIFRDCHCASAGLTRVMKQLLLSLANLGWGRTRIILEYRDGAEASSSWRGFVEMDLPALAHAVVDAQLSAVGCNDIEQALIAITVDPHCGPLAHAVFEKTGGNPLLIHHLLLHFAEKGYIVPADDLATRMRVASFGDIDHELAYDIKLPDDVLPARIKYLIDALPNERREPALRYLTGAAFSGLQYEESLFSAAWANGTETPESIRHWLMDSEIIEQVFDEDRLQFIHDFMWLAMRTVLTRREDFRLYGESVLNSLPPDKVLAHVIAGGLLTSLGRPFEAFQRFDAGQELAKLQGLLLQQERCLTGARDVLETIPSEDAPLLQRRAAIGLALAGTLTQTGSQIRALDALMRVRRLLDSKRAPFLLPGPERSMLAAGVVRQRLILLVRMMRGEEFFDHFGECANHRLASEDVHLALTRYALMAMHCCQVEAAWRSLPYAIATCPPEGDSLSSLQSDIGRLYLQADPQTAKEHWERGLALAKERRQFSHSRLNLLVAALYLGGEVPGNKELDVLEEDLRTQGVANQLYRLWNCRGILAARDGRVSLASEYFQRALSQSQSTDQPYWQWKSHNNMAVCMAYQGKREDAESHLLTALSLTASLVAVSGRTPQEIVQPLMCVAVEHRLGVRTDILHKPAPPASCGLLPILLRNVSALRSAGGGISLTESVAGAADWRFPQVGQCLLWLDAGGIMLTFAIE